MTQSSGSCRVAQLFKCLAKNAACPVVGNPQGSAGVTRSFRFSLPYSKYRANHILLPVRQLAQSGKQGVVVLRVLQGGVW
jgi:hypothetical protein